MVSSLRASTEARVERLVSQLYKHAADIADGTSARNEVQEKIHDPHLTSHHGESQTCIDMLEQDRVGDIAAFRDVEENVHETHATFYPNAGEASCADTMQMEQEPEDEIEEVFTEGALREMRAQHERGQHRSGRSSRRNDRTRGSNFQDSDEETDEQYSDSFEAEDENPPYSSSEDAMEDLGQAFADEDAEELAQVMEDYIAMDGMMRGMGFNTGGIFPDEGGFGVDDALAALLMSAGSQERY